MFTFLCSILPLFFKYPQDRCPAARINTHLVHCLFLWWPQHAFAEVEALLTPFYQEKWQHSAQTCRTKQGQEQQGTKPRYFLTQPNVAQPGSEPLSEP